MNDIQILKQKLINEFAVDINDCVISVEHLVLVPFKQDLVAPDYANMTPLYNPFISDYVHRYCIPNTNDCYVVSKFWSDEGEVKGFIRDYNSNLVMLDGNGIDLKLRNFSTILRGLIEVELKNTNIVNIELIRIKF